jgi:hypothetical protein
MKEPWCLAATEGGLSAAAIANLNDCIFAARVRDDRPKSYA